MPYTPDSFSDGQVLSASHVNKLGTQHAQALSDVAATYATNAGLTANYYTKSQADARYLAVGAGTIAGPLTINGQLTISYPNAFYSNYLSFLKTTSVDGALKLTLAAHKGVSGMFVPRDDVNIPDSAGRNIIASSQDALAYIGDYAASAITATPSPNSGSLPTLTREFPAVPSTTNVTWNIGAAFPVLTMNVPASMRPALGGGYVVFYAYKAYIDLYYTGPSAVKIESYNGSSWTTRYNGILSWTSTSIGVVASSFVNAVLPTDTQTIKITFSDGSYSTLPYEFQLVKVSYHSAGAPWDTHSLSREPGDQYLFGLPQFRNIADGRRVEFDGATNQKRGLGLASTNELNLYIPSGGTVKVRQDSSSGTVIGRVVTTSGDNAKLATRRVPLMLDPQHQNDTAPAGACVWSVVAGGGGAVVRWKSATSQTYRWLAYYGHVPADYTGSLVIKARLKVVDGGSSVNIQNWQSYLDVYMDGEDNSFSVANPDTFGSTSIGTTWQTVTIKSVSMPGSNGAGSNIYGYFGPGGTAVTWGSDVLCGGVWCEYDAAY